MTFGPVGIRCPDHAGAAARPGRAGRRSAPRDTFPLAVRPVRHVRAHRDQRRRLPSRAPARRPDQRDRKLDLRARGSLRPARRRWRVVAPHHVGLSSLRVLAPRDEHARALVHRARPRGLPRARALRAALHRLRARGGRRRAHRVAERAHGGSVGSDLGSHGGCARPRSAAYLRLRRAGAGPRRHKPRPHLRDTRSLDRRAHRRADRRRGLRARVFQPAPQPQSRDARGRRCRRSSASSSLSRRSSRRLRRP